MPASQLIGRGIGFSPGSVEFIITHGLGTGEAAEPIQLGNLGFGDRSYVKRRAREWEEARRKRWESQTRDEIALSLAAELGLLDEAGSVLVEEAAEEVEAILEPYRADEGIDWEGLAQDMARLDALLSGLARLQAEIEYQRDEEAIALLLFSE